jgi:hypothetical protein
LRLFSEDGCNFSNFGQLDSKDVGLVLANFCRFGGPIGSRLPVGETDDRLLYDKEENI